ncbi:MAG: DNA-3-methyladenine glycosylase 2 family protein, partial [Proteobacteria bacterium]|nr:DNA-3-methyladenine glycosylase 2 family protein [Pseudomonadota bacterium]
RTMFARVATQLGGITPQTIAAAGIDGLRALGLTRQKAAYCHGLAERLRSGALDLRAVTRAPEAEARAMLLAVPGLGPWSVDIYFIMALRRPDIWPQGDLALAIVLAQVKRLRSRPDAARQRKLAEAWSPWRAVAARLLWQHYLAQRGRLQ